MQLQGNLVKMRAENDVPIRYYMHLDGNELSVNDWIGSTVDIQYLNQINCIRCGRVTKKSFGQGFCYPCFKTAPEASPCILKPELCRAHEGESRDMEWSKTHCLIDHYVYLSITSGLKVGVTRDNQIPTRWIDQGASQAVAIAQTPNRYLAGLIEVALKSHYADRTNWRNMLMNKSDPGIDLSNAKKEIYAYLPEHLQAYYINREIVYLEYPVGVYPVKVKSIGLEKTGDFKGVLKGVKGQYLIFDEGYVFNVRNHSGYLVELRV